MTSTAMYGTQAVSDEEALPWQSPFDSDVEAHDSDDSEVSGEESAASGGDASGAEDLVRLYLCQIGQFPLLSRRQEMALAKAVEVTRRRFRRGLLECDSVLRMAWDVLQQVHRGELPFDRTVQVAVSDRLERHHIVGRLPHNLTTLKALLERNGEDYRTATSGASSPSRRRSAWRR